MFHINAFVQAGDQRLHMAWNTSPDEVPYFADIHAPMTRGFSGGRQPRHWSRLLVSRWDAQHYEGFAARGFAACPTAPMTEARVPTSFVPRLWPRLVAGVGLGSAT